MKKKLVLLLATPVAIAAPLVTAVSCNWYDNKPSFYNYEDYMADEIIDQIDGTFSYSTFGDLPTFESQIRQRKTAGGIGTDYLNATLAKEGLLKKIDFSKVFPDVITSGMSRDEVAVALQGIYSEQAWDLMAGFDVFIQEDGGDDHLWEYMIPYFIQNKAVAFDLEDSMKDATTGKRWSTAEYTKIKSGVESDIQSVFDKNGDKDLTYTEIFTTLREHGYTSLVVNDYWRDNLMIGSEVTGNFKTEFESFADAKAQINGFKTVLESFTGVGNTKNVLFRTSGGDTLDALINKEEDIDVATLYNGDALDAYYSEDNYEDDPYYVDPHIGVVKATDSTYLLDGMIIPAYVDEGTANLLYNVASQMLFEGATAPADATLQDTKIYENFDFVNYTTPFKNLFETLGNGQANDYFDGDVLAQYISLEMVKGEVDANHVTQPIAKDLQTLALDEYKRVFPNSEQ